MKMDQVSRLLPLLILMCLVAPVHCKTQYLYFSDFNHCDQVYTVPRDVVIQIGAMRASETGRSAFRDCAFLFRAGNLRDKLCMKISTLTFSSNDLQFQYFTSLDSTAGRPELIYEYVNSASTPMEICQDEYEISMKLHAWGSSAKLSEVNLLIEVYNMQGTQRKAYMDTDCGMTFKLRDSTVYVQNANPAEPNNLHSVCQLYFEYVGANPNTTLCINYQNLMDTCGYELKVYEGSAVWSTLAHTYSCGSVLPQSWCAKKPTAFLELVVNSEKPLPVGLFKMEIKDSPTHFSPIG